MRLRCGVVLMMAMMLAACKSRRASLPDQPESVVGGLYTQVLARHAVGIPGQADMRAFAPYLSRGLLEKIHAADGCMSDFYAKNAGRDSKLEVSWAGLRLFAGDTFSGDQRGEPDVFKIEKTESEKDGSFRVSLEIARKESPTYTLTVPVAVLVREEHGDYVVDDVIYQSEHTRWVGENSQQTYSTDDARLSQYLSVGCGAVAKLIRGLYTQVMARPAHDAAAPEDWKTFAPYLSQTLLHKIDVATACSEDWDRQNPYPPLKAPRPSADRFLSDGEGFVDLSGFKLQLIRPDKDGLLRMYINLDIEKADRRVAPVVIQEGGRFVVDDVMYVNDSDYEDYPKSKPADKRFSEYLTAGCDGPRWVRESLPSEPVALVQSLYTQVVARVPSGVPYGENWKVFAPYLSKALLHSIDVYDACMNDWDRKYGKSDPPVKAPGLAESGIFSGSNELTGPADFRVENSVAQADGAVRVYVTLTWRDWGWRHDTVTWRVADVLVREDGRWLLNDVIILKDKKINMDADESLLKNLAYEPECKGPRWVGWR